MPAIIIDPRRPAIAGTKIGKSPVSFAAAARNVVVGESWAFHDHRTMQQVMADERAARGRAVIACKKPDCGAIGPISPITPHVACRQRRQSQRLAGKR